MQTKNERGRTAYTSPPARFPFYMKVGMWITKKKRKKDLLGPKLLAWYPQTALGSGVLEMLIAHGDEHISARLLRLLRI